jgi:hypothetical protein
MSEYSLACLLGLTDLLVVKDNRRQGSSWSWSKGTELLVEEMELGRWADGWIELLEKMLFCWFQMRPNQALYIARGHTISQVTIVVQPDDMAHTDGGFLHTYSQHRASPCSSIF